MSNQYPWIDLGPVFAHCKKRLLDVIDGQLFTAYGQFPEIDAILDDFRAKMLAVEMGDADD